MKIKIEKINEVDGGIPAIPIEQHVPGQFQGENYSVPISYWVEGELINNMEVGSPIFIKRHSRNGILVDGYMQTSTVTKINKDTFETRNSVYRYSLYD
jgi:hypothetical protein